MHGICNNELLGPRAGGGYSSTILIDSLPGVRKFMHSYYSQVRLYDSFLHSSLPASFYVRFTPSEKNISAHR